MATKYFVLFFMVSLLAGCTAKRLLRSGDRFYTGASVKIEKGEDANYKKSDAQSLAEEQLMPDPNDKILGNRPTVWFYLKPDTSKKKGIGPFLKKKFGREPVLYSDQIPNRTMKLIKNKLFNNGFFHPKVEYTLDESEKTVSINYIVYPGNRYYLDSIFFQNRGDSLSAYIEESLENTLVEKGDPYSLDVLKSERQRMNEYLKNKGFYYFQDDYIKFKVDTNAIPDSLILAITLKPNIPDYVRVPNYITKVNLWPDFKLGGDTSYYAQSTEDSITYYDNERNVRHDVLKEAIFLNQGDRYKIDNHKLTIRRLASLNLYRYVDVRLEQEDSLSAGLIANVYLTPLLPQSVRVEVGASTKSNNFTGPGIDFSYAHKNLFRGVERFDAGFGGSFETQLGKGVQKGVNAIELSVSTKLSVPRLWTPIKLNYNKLKEFPRTETGVSYKMLIRTNYYRLHNANVSFGYRWEDARRMRHQFTLANVNYTRAAEISGTFNEFLLNNPELKRVFDEQLIVGTKYTMEYYTKPPKNRKHYWYFSPGVEVAGNSLNLLASNLFPDQEKPYELLGIQFAQFVKFDLDTRHYEPLGKQSKLAMRFYGGLGIPYGNSTNLPYLKQYFIGGSTSIRAFQARTVGPGRYNSTNSDGLQLDQSGDMKLELNVEYRHIIYKFLEGAAFVDLGNVWLLEDPDRPEGVFDFNTFTEEIAIGTGLGIRLNFGYFLIRSDFAIPVHVPWLTPEERWVIEDFGLGNGWLGDNLLVNIAIGYPF